MDINQLLMIANQKSASDLHLSTELSPLLRIDGELISLNLPAVTSNNLKELISRWITENQKQLFQQQGHLDFAVTIETTRLRVHAFQQARGLSLACRLLPQNIPSWDTLNLPSSLRALTQHQSGLILVTGAAGSGKSTTLAALLDSINREQAKHFITVEDPIEYWHLCQRSLIHQREIDHHVSNFPSALKAALREDPDGLVVGEVRDLESLRLALSAAETGHLVFGTLHAQTPIQALYRILDSFPVEEKNLIRSMLADSLVAVISQQLVRRRQGGRIPIVEIMIKNNAIKHLIRESQFAQIMSCIQTGRLQGMQTFDQHAQQLLEDGVICDVTRERVRMISVN